MEEGRLKPVTESKRAIFPTGERVGGQTGEIGGSRLDGRNTGDHWGKNRALYCIRNEDGTGTGSGDRASERQALKDSQLASYKGRQKCERSLLGVYESTADWTEGEGDPQWENITLSQLYRY
ncbi:hypothetical protein JZ751_011206 [Albula glossodonta]|uniref:Uncharacterized protein n=1 Tax=Albula glossodonta TaxID=121402 RepID=A0A8T2NYD3_9TELE|nr:hypothetical protein JZ751_011206 [Albula glossodonta]